MNSLKSSRDYYFDNLKYILILFVVIGHTIEPIIVSSHTLSTLYKFFYFFHMPLFVFISGYFSKNLNSKDYAKKTISNILVPYLIFQTLYSSMHYLIYKDVFYGFFSPYWIMWYLFCLNFWKIILPFVTKIKYNIILFFTLGIMVGYMTDAGYHASIQRIFAFFPYFLLGYYFERKYLEKLFNLSVRLISLVILFTSLLLIYFYGQNIQIQWLTMPIPYQDFNHIEWYAGLFRALVYCVSITISICILSLIPNRKLLYISEAGKRTLYIYLYHGFLILYLKSTDFYFQINTKFEKVGLIILGMVITFMLSLKIIETITKPIVSPNLDKFFKH